MLAIGREENSPARTTVTKAVCHDDSGGVALQRGYYQWCSHHGDMQGVVVRLDVAENMVLVFEAWGAGCGTRGWSLDFSGP